MGARALRVAAALFPAPRPGAAYRAGVGDWPSLRPGGVVRALEYRHPGRCGGASAGGTVGWAGCPGWTGSEGWGGVSGGVVLGVCCIGNDSFNGYNPAAAAAVACPVAIAPVPNLAIGRPLSSVLARVAELVDAAGLGPVVERCGGSSPSARTNSATAVRKTGQHGIRGSYSRFQLGLRRDHEDRRDGKRRPEAGL